MLYLLWFLWSNYTVAYHIPPEKHSNLAFFLKISSQLLQCLIAKVENITYNEFKPIHQCKNGFCKVYACQGGGTVSAVWTQSKHKRE